MSPKAIEVTSTPAPVVTPSAIVTPETAELFYRAPEAGKRGYRTVAAQIADEAEDLSGKVSEMVRGIVRASRDRAALSGSAYKSERAKIEAAFSTVISRLDEVSSLMLDAITTAESMTKTENAKPDAKE